MGMMVNGVWDDLADTTINRGAFRRSPSVFGAEVASQDIEAIGRGERRHVLLASMSCPWSHRVLLVRAVKSLEHVLPLHLAGGPRIEGYSLLPAGPLRFNGVAPKHVHQLYARTRSNYTGRVTVPLLWDSSTQTIISNDSSRIMRALDQVEGTQFTLAPAHLAREIDQLNDSIHTGLANAVYRAGLAQKQSSYDEAVTKVFETLTFLEERLTSDRFLFGPGLTETDLRLFATLVRFDAVYVTHFRCTRYRLIDYPNLWAYARDLYQWPGIAQTVDFDAIMAGYFLNDGQHNPHGILSERPFADWLAPSGRENLGSAGLWSVAGDLISSSCSQTQ